MNHKDAEGLCWGAGSWQLSRRSWQLSRRNTLTPGNKWPPGCKSMVCAIFQSAIVTKLDLQTNIDTFPFLMLHSYQNNHKQPQKTLLYDQWKKNKYKLWRVESETFVNWCNAEIKILLNMHSLYDIHCCISPKMVIIFTILPLQSRHFCNSESVMHLCILSKSICNNHFYLYIFISHEKCQFMLNSTLFWAILRLFLMCIYIKIYLFPFCWTYFGADCEGPLGYDRLRLWQLFVFTALLKLCTNINSVHILLIHFQWACVFYSDFVESVHYVRSHNLELRALGTGHDF